MTLFDQLCREVEIGKLPLKTRLTEAAYFQLKDEDYKEIRDHILSLGNITEIQDTLREQFLFPFDNIVLENGESCVAVLVDSYGIGLENVRLSFMHSSITTSGKKGFVCFSDIRVEVGETTNTYHDDGRSPVFFICDGEITPILDPHKTFPGGTLAEMFDKALWVIFGLQQPGRIFVKREHRQPPKIAKKTIPRSNQRARYLSLPAISIVDTLEHLTGTKLVKGHRRAAHWRFLRSEKYTNKRGQWVRVKSCWVGPDTIEAGPYIYKVMHNHLAEIPPDRIVETAGNCA